MHNDIRPGVSSRKNNVSIKVDRRGIKRWFDASLFVGACNLYPFTHAPLPLFACTLAFLLLHFYLPDCRPVSPFCQTSSEALPHLNGSFSTLERLLLHT